MFTQGLFFRSGFLFPTVAKTERPEAVTAALLGGRAVILLYGSPVALILPTVFSDIFHSPEDYYNRPAAAPDAPGGHDAGAGGVAALRRADHRAPQHEARIATSTCRTGILPSSVIAVARMGRSARSTTPRGTLDSPTARTILPA